MATVKLTLQKLKKLANNPKALAAFPILGSISKPAVKSGKSCCGQKAAGKEIIKNNAISILKAFTEMSAENIVKLKQFLNATEIEVIIPIDGKLKTKVL